MTPWEVKVGNFFKNLFFIQKDGMERSWDPSTTKYYYENDGPYEVNDSPEEDMYLIH